ncbi:MAG: hypothetical protein RLZZ628_4284 [Bacteroidota bacterium]|jgi:hypothetical protein
MRIMTVFVRFEGLKNLSKFAKINITRISIKIKKNVLLFGLEPTFGLLISTKILICIYMTNFFFKFFLKIFENLR